MDARKYFRFFMIAVSSVFACILVFMFCSMLFVIKMLLDDGGIYAFNSGNFIGHLLIILFSAGILYFSIKITRRLKEG